MCLDNFSVFIPARGGSKSIKQKNLQKIDNLPLVERSIQLALKRFDPERIVISSDCENILNIGNNYNVELHFRSEETSGDSATTESAVREYLLPKKLISKWLILIEPTSPFLSLSDLNKLVDLCNSNNDASCIYSVSEIRHTKLEI